MSPFRCPSLFTILSFLEYEHGVYHPVGGCGAVSEAMAGLARRMGVDIRLGAGVERVLFEGKRASGVVCDGETLQADAVVINGDFAKVIQDLVPQQHRPRWRDAKIEKARLSCSTFMLYLGLDGPMPEALGHHTILLSEDYARNIREITDGILLDAALALRAACGLHRRRHGAARPDQPLRAGAGAEPEGRHRLAEACARAIAGSCSTA